MAGQDLLAGDQGNVDLLQGQDLLGSTTEPKTRTIGTRFGIVKAAPSDTGEMLKAMGKGTVKGLLGAPGELEKFGAYTVPEFLGAAKTPEAERVEVFPTSETVGKMLGFKETPERYKPVETLSEVIGSFGLPLGEAGTGEKTLSRYERTLKPATSKSAVGEKLESTLTKRLDDLISSRRKEFEGIKDAYLEAGSAKEGQILNDYKTALNNYYNAKKLSEDERVLLLKSLNRLSARPASLLEKDGELVEPGFEVIEKERRFLNDVAKGLKVEGAEAIPAESARNMANILESVIAKNVPNEFNNFKQTYTTLSEPINQYNRAVGQAVTKRADEYLPEVSKIDPASLPSKFFSSRRSINDLRALSGDEKFVQDVAREHVATELRGAKDAQTIRDYIAKNYDWLQELPAIRKDLEGIAATRKGTEIAKSLAKWGAGLLAVGVGADALSSGTKKLFGILGD